MMLANAWQDFVDNIAFHKHSLSWLDECLIFFYISIWNISYTLLSSLDCVLEIKDIAVMMIFPYFLESHVTEAFPSLKLMDYKVNINVRSPSSHVPPT